MACAGETLKIYKIDKDRTVSTNTRKRTQEFAVIILHHTAPHFK
jgi:hypothetical protein